MIILQISFFRQNTEGCGVFPIIHGPVPFARTRIGTLQTLTFNLTILFSRWFGTPLSIGLMWWMRASAGRFWDLFAGRSCALGPTKPSRPFQAPPVTSARRDALVASAAPGWIICSASAGTACAPPGFLLGTTCPSGPVCTAFGMNNEDLSRFHCLLRKPVKGQYGR